MVKQLPQWRTAVSAPGLLAVDGVQGLVNKQADSTQQVRPEGSLKQQPQNRVKLATQKLIPKTGSLLLKNSVLLCLTAASKCAVKMRKHKCP